VAQAMAMKSEFISSVSHELRTPLAISREALSLILRGKIGEISEKQNDIVSMASKNLDRLGYLINDILDIAKIEAGRMDLFKEMIDVSKLVKECCDAWKLKTATKELNLECNIPASKLEIPVDKTRFMQVLSNLINNAVKFTPPKGKVTVSINERGEYVEFSVKDSGVGISEEDSKKLFQKFQQVNRTPGAGAKGTGLGLSIVKSLIELHGGEVGVESKINKGSRFFFTIPKQESC